MTNNKPVKTYRSGNIQGALWLNEKEKDGQIIGYKTLSVRRSWKDNEKNIWRDETLNLRKQDIPKVMLILQKLQEDVLLAHEEGEEEDEQA